MKYLIIHCKDRDYKDLLCLIIGFPINLICLSYYLYKFKFEKIYILTEMGVKIVKSNTLLERLNPNFKSLVNDWPDSKVRKNVSAKKLLFSSGRFDLIAKFLYLQSIENNIQTDWYRELYLSTISAFNNFHTI